MVQSLFFVALLAGCGRIGFDDHHPAGAGAEAGSNGSGSGSNGGDAGLDDGSTAVCPYITTCGVKVTCCVGGATSCTSAGGCTGTIIPCDVDPPFTPCGTMQACCHQPDAGLACFDPPLPC